MPAFGLGTHLTLPCCRAVLPCCGVSGVASDQRAFVITLTRAGEDNARFQLTDTESTFASFAGADYDLQVRPPVPQHAGSFAAVLGGFGHCLGGCCVIV